MLERNEKFVEPNFLISTRENAVGRKQRKKRRRNMRGREGVFAKVGLGKDKVERINVDPSNILVPAALPPDVEEQLGPAPYAFSSMLTYSQRKKSSVPMSGDKPLSAQELYSPTRHTFAAELSKNTQHVQDDQDEYEPEDSTAINSGLNDSSTLSSFDSFSDTASHGMGIASRAMKLVASGSTTSFGRSQRFAEENRRRKNTRVDRFYDVDGGVKCSLSKSVAKSLFGTSMAHNEAPRFPKKSSKLVQPDTVGPGSYKVSYGLVSTRISDRWDVQSASFKGVQRSKPSVQSGGRRIERRAERSSGGRGGSKSLPTLQLLAQGESSPYATKKNCTRRQQQQTGHCVRYQSPNQRKPAPVHARAAEQHQLSLSKLSHSSWDDSQAWNAEDNENINAPKNRSKGSKGSLVVDMAAASPMVSPGSSVINDFPGLLVSDGSQRGKITPQASIISMNDFMEDKF